MLAVLLILALSTLNKETEATWRVEDGEFILDYPVEQVEKDYVLYLKTKRDSPGLKTLCPDECYLDSKHNVQNKADERGFKPRNSVEAANTGGPYLRTTRPFNKWIRPKGVYNTEMI